jgi:hypothetical protein
MAERYQIASTNSNGRLPDAKELARFLAKDKQMLLPMLNLIEQCGINDVVDVTGRATIDAVLQISAAPVAGPGSHLGTSSGVARHHFDRAQFETNFEVPISCPRRQGRVQAPRCVASRRRVGYPG